MTKFIKFLTILAQDKVMGAAQELTPEVTNLFIILMVLFSIIFLCIVGSVIPFWLLGFVDDED